MNNDDIFELGAPPTEAPEVLEYSDIEGLGIYDEDSLSDDMEVIQYEPYDYSDTLITINDNINTLSATVSLLDENLSNVLDVSSSILLFLVFYVSLYIGRGFASSLRKRGL